MELKRGDIVTTATRADFSKPRPVLVLQSYLPVGIEAVTVVPFTSDLRDMPTIRLSVTPSLQTASCWSRSSWSIAFKRS